MTSEESMIERLLVAVAGPVVTAVLGTLVIGLIAQWVTRRIQDNRDASEIRRELVTDLTEVAGSISLELGAFHRLKQCVAGGGAPVRRLVRAREALERKHFDARVRGWVLERRLEIHFGKDSSAKRSWHKTLDSLHLAYLCLVDRQIPHDAYREMLEHADLAGTLDGSTEDVERVRTASSDGLKDATTHILIERMLVPRTRRRRGAGWGLVRTSRSAHLSGVR